MAAPTGSDGLKRGLTEFAEPPIVVILAVIFTEELIGGFAAGIIYLLLTGGILAGIYFAAKNWNIPYTAGFVFSGLILTRMVPDILSDILHPVFDFLGTLILVAFLIGMIYLLMEKTGVDEALNNW